MVSVRHYLMSVIAAAFVCSIVRALTHTKGASASIINIATAAFLVITVISPWKHWSLSSIPEHIKDYAETADGIVAQGVSASQSETLDIIKQQTEAYIVDKAKALGVDLQADVTVSGTSPTQLVEVVITADTSPYMKQRISREISAELGIPEACQIWK